MPSPRCPRCGFSFGWNGRMCSHCPPPSRARQLWEEIGRLEEQIHASKDFTVRQLLAITAGCIRNAKEHLPAELQDAAAVFELGPAAFRMERYPFDQHIDTIVVAARRRFVPELFRAVVTFAGVCREQIANTNHPIRELLSFSLPPELERHRENVARESGPGRMRVLSRRAEDDPILVAYEHLNHQLSEYNRARWNVMTTEEAAQCAVARDVLGYPEVAVTFDAKWRTSTVVAMAQGMLESRDFSAMPILADALQDADCEDPEVLEHCRAEKPHHPGCWVIRRILATRDG